MKPPPFDYERPVDHQWCACFTAKLLQRLVRQWAQSGRMRNRPVTVWSTCGSSYRSGLTARV
jgi:hypothetical protein